MSVILTSSIVAGIVALSSDVMVSGITYTLMSKVKGGKDPLADIRKGKDDDYKNLFS